MTLEKQLTAMGRIFDHLRQLTESSTEDAALKRLVTDLALAAGAVSSELYRREVAAVEAAGGGEEICTVFKPGRDGEVESVTLCKGLERRRFRQASDATVFTTVHTGMERLFPLLFHMEMQPAKAVCL
jgi:hypothetical protein